MKKATIRVKLPKSDINDVQAEALYYVDQCKGLPKPTARFNSSTMRALENKGYLRERLYANGLFFELTEKGCTMIGTLRDKIAGTDK